LGLAEVIVEDRSDLKYDVGAFCLSVLRPPPGLTMPLSHNG